MNIVVMGAGAIGSLFGGLLSKKNNVILIGRSPHVNAIRKNGLNIEDKTTLNVKIPAQDLRLTLPGFVILEGIPTLSYLIDKHEVTNSQYKEFMDNGGYEKAEYWKEKFIKDGKEIPWQSAMSLFRDQTGRTGPSAWAGGTYPEGHDNFPVSGISWFEAAAFAEYKGKNLPTVYHWLGATNTRYASVLIQHSNFSKLFWICRCH